MLSIEEALFKVLADVTTCHSESVALLSSLGRVLQEPIHAPADMPPFANSAMDGYALRSSDTAGASPGTPVSLQVTQEIPAAAWPTETLQAGQSARIFTGAPIPPGADAVELQENVERSGDTVTFTVPVPAQKSIRAQAAYLQAGQVMLPNGAPIGPGEIGLLASIGRTSVLVPRQPRVAILSCGDELRPLYTPPKPGQIFESNRYALSAQVIDAGAIPTQLPLTPDQPAAIEAQLTHGAQADILLSSGGVSVGEYDLVRPALEALGFEIVFWKVAIKPGKPLVFARKGKCLFFGLPGNPGSSMVTFELFVRPVLRKMLGYKNIFRPKIKAELLAPARPTKTRTHFVRGQLIHSDHAPLGFMPHAKQGSGNLLSMQQVEALAVLEPGEGTLETGTTVDILFLAPHWRGRPVF